MQRLLLSLSLVISLLIGAGGWFFPTLSVSALELEPQSATVLVAKAELFSPTEVRLCQDLAEKIDLNNVNLTAFTDCPGFYPNLAKLIVFNGPYAKVEDVLTIPDLSDYQQELLQANLDNFTVNEPITPPEMRMSPRPAMGKFPGQ